MKTLSILTYRPRTRRNRIIATILVVAIIAFASYWWTTQYGPDRHKPTPPAQLHMVQPAPPAMLIANHLGPKGSYIKCYWRLFGVIPYRDCAFLLQPGSTRDFDDLLARNENGATDATIVASSFGAMCSWVGLPVAFICAAIGLWYAKQVIDYTHTARLNMQCLRVRYIIVGTGAPINVRIDNYGKWETWIYYTGSDGLTHRSWWYPTSCKMPADCTPIYQCVI